MARGLGPDEVSGELFQGFTTSPADEAEEVLRQASAKRVQQQLLQGEVQSPELLRKLAAEIRRGFPTKTSSSEAFLPKTRELFDLFVAESKQRKSQAEYTVVYTFGKVLEELVGVVWETREVSWVMLCVGILDLFSHIPTTPIQLTLDAMKQVRGRGPFDHIYSVLAAEALPYMLERIAANSEQEPKPEGETEK